MDLGEALYGERQMGVRRLIALLRGLPRDNALAREIDPDTAMWGTAEQVLWTLAQLQDEANMLAFRANFKGAFRKPIKRVLYGRKKLSTKQEVTRFFKAAAREGGAIVKHITDRE